MKLYCPHCKSPVSSPPIRPTDGLLNCHNCKKSFRIINALENAPEINRVQREPEFRSGIVNTASGITFHFRGKKSITTVIVLSVFGCFLLVGPFISNQEQDSIVVRLIASGFGTIFLYPSFWILTEQEELQIRDYSIIYVKRHFGISTMNIQPRVLFGSISEDVEYDSYNNPSFYLRMEFSNGEGFRFGNNLSHSERVWLIGEIEAAIHQTHS